MIWLFVSSIMCNLEKGKVLISKVTEDWWWTMRYVINFLPFLTLSVMLKLTFNIRQFKFEYWDLIWK